MKILKINILGLSILIFSLLTSCNSSKVNYTDDAINALEVLVAGKKFEIESNWAYPLPSNGLNNLASAGLFRPGDNANQINLIGNSNFLRIEGDSIKAQLPYYGERRISAGYSTDTGISLNGLIEDLKINFNEKNKYYELVFKANKNTESYQIAINIFPNKETHINVNSTHRTNIRYRGVVNAIEE